MPRVLIAASSPVVRAGLDALLGRSGGALAVVGAASGPAAVAERAHALEPDVVLLVLEPHEGPPPRVRLVSDAAARTPALVVLADAPDAGWTVAALRAGARAVLPRDATPEAIVAAVDAAAAGLVTIHADYLDPLLGEPPYHADIPAAADGAPPQPLSPREAEILALLAEGLGNKQIAARLRISGHTVKAHVTSIFAKLHATTRAEAVAIGARRGVIML